MPWARQKIRLIRIGRADAIECLAEGYRIARSESGKSWELISPDGEAVYWITNKCKESIDGQ